MFLISNFEMKMKPKNLDYVCGLNVETFNDFLY